MTNNNALKKLNCFLQNSIVLRSLAILIVNGSTFFNMKNTSYYVGSLCSRGTSTAFGNSVSQVKVQSFITVPFFHN